MHLTLAIPSDELLLAKLLVSKLAKVMHGLFSVGLGSVAMEHPTGVDFLNGRDRVSLGFLDVLRCIDVTPGNADKLALLRHHMEKVAEATTHFHCLLTKLAGWRAMTVRDIRAVADRLGESYVDFCRLLGEFSSWLGMETDFRDQALQDRNYLEAVIDKLPLESPTVPISLPG
jgi:hypothetical protein